MRSRSRCRILTRACGSTAIPSGTSCGGATTPSARPGLALAAGDTEIVLTTRHGYEPDWLVDSADEAAAVVQAAGGRIVTEPFDIPVGRLVVVAYPFGNVLVLLDLSKGRYVTDATGNVTAVAP